MPLRARKLFARETIADNDASAEFVAGVFDNVAVDDLTVGDNFGANSTDVVAANVVDTADDSTAKVGEAASDCLACFVRPSIGSPRVGSVVFLFRGFFSGC